MLKKLQHAGIVGLRSFTSLVVALPIGLNIHFARALATAAIAGGLSFLVDFVAHN